ncbi:DUF504 domain-containing protein [Methanothermobacter wolfeii]|uniref:UPF0248 protein N5910_08640 n=1 Tax=Methanothermobacter wolfeii TaxID=145261 RepID=A0A9E7RTJ4_METWO|nr:MULTISPECIES: DUF504 domain-containing protein [Methanothermobacter]MDI6702560.1 DUF504 domain-containing protein [Methanothermobacter wolfeii]MDI6841777.1 DUF504 domain-containing protein [Methanothermobacter wolfeii]NLM02195.1 DUF504 domain-containing protein [Methanothermobacter wolfeii]QHN06995.1 DUF504 domain-containing protein [Methanothermobacter sp. THM-1]UXH31591.1 DUF504 domain-containing protein [Methanothermobacter wolfeii]
MAKNVLDLLMWHPKWDIEECVISYVHRGAQRNLKTINGSEISRLERGFIILKDGRSIPYHRVVKIVCGDSFIWKKQEKG